MAAKTPTRNQYANTFQSSAPPRFNPYYNKRATIAHHQAPSSSPKTPSPVSENTELVPMMGFGEHVGNNLLSLSNMGTVIAGTPPPNLGGDMNSKRITGGIGYGNKTSVQPQQGNTYCIQTPPPTCHVPVATRNKPAATQQSPSQRMAGLANVLKQKIVTALSIEDVLEIARCKAKGITHYKREMESAGNGGDDAEVMLIEMFATPHILLQSNHPSLLSFMVRNPVSISTSSLIRCDYWQIGHQLDRTVFYPQRDEEVVLRLVGVARMQDTGDREVVFQCFGIRRSQPREHSTLHAILLAQLTALPSGSIDSSDPMDEQFSNTQETSELISMLDSVNDGNDAARRCQYQNMGQRNMMKEASNRYNI